MMKWKIDMTEEEAAALIAQIEAQEAAYESALAEADAQSLKALEEGFEPDELETEADLYRYWKP